MTHSIEVLPETFAVASLPAADAVPAWAHQGISFTGRTPEELSIVCREHNVPPDAIAERGWRCMRVAGKLDFALVGVLTSILQPLAEASVPVFVMSTFGTDYVMVKTGDLDRARTALERAGHSVRDRAVAPSPQRAGS